MKFSYKQNPVLKKKTVQTFYKLLLLAATGAIASTPLISLKTWAQENRTQGPIRVQSLIASFDTDKYSSTLLETTLNSVLNKDASTEDKLLGIATFALAAYLDELAIDANKFESVPQYRITQVMRTLLAANRLSKNETPHEIYNRLVNNWKKACEPRIAAGRGCEFSFRFDKNSWTQGQPDFFSRLDKSHIRHVNSRSVYAENRASIHDMANKALKEGKASVDVNGKTYTLLKAASDNQTTLINKATDVWKNITLDRHYFIIDNDYIAQQYRNEIRAAIETLSSQSTAEISIANQRVNINSPTGTTKEELYSKTLEAFRKLHSKQYFGTEDLVIFQRSPVARELRMHQWDGFSFRLPEAPATYEAFMGELRSQLNTIYLARTRKTMMNQLLGSNANQSIFFVAPHETKNYLAGIPAYRRKGEFVLIDLPLQQDIDEATLKEASTMIVDTFSERKGDNPQDIFADIELKLQQLGISTQAQKIKSDLKYSKILPPPQASRDLQIYQMLFTEQMSQDRGMQAPELPDLIYFIDKDKASLSFISTLSMETIKTDRIQISDPGIDQIQIQELITQKRFADLYQKTINKIFDQSMYISIRNSEYIYGEQRSIFRMKEDLEAIKKVIAKSVASLEQVAPGAGWSRFMEGVQKAPITPLDLRKKEVEKPKGWFRPAR